MMKTYIDDRNSGTNDADDDTTYSFFKTAK